MEEIIQHRIYIQILNIKSQICEYKGKIFRDVDRSLTLSTSHAQGKWLVKKLESKVERVNDPLGHWGSNGCFTVKILTGDRRVNDRWLQSFELIILFNKKNFAIFRLFSIQFDESNINPGFLQHIDIINF